jgi:hypothetical protein
VTPKPLTPDQHRAADLLGRGFSQAEVAGELTTTTTSIRRWQKRDDFATLVKQAREQALDANPTARSTLEGLLTATTKDGRPANALRLQAAVALLRVSDEGEAKSNRVVERVYIGEDE